MTTKTRLSIFVVTEGGGRLLHAEQNDDPP